MGRDADPDLSYFDIHTEISNEEDFNLSNVGHKMFYGKFDFIQGQRRVKCELRVTHIR